MFQKKVWAVCLSTDNDFIPDFSVEGKFENVLQIHSTKKSAEKLVKKLGNDWCMVECKLQKSK
jgi:hypothetical protein